jgi:hypothetical protein
MKKTKDAAGQTVGLPASSDMGKLTLGPCHPSVRETMPPVESMGALKKKVQTAGIN